MSLEEEMFGPGNKMSVNDPIYAAYIRMKEFADKHEDKCEISAIQPNEVPMLSYLLKHFPKETEKHATELRLSFLDWITSITRFTGYATEANKGMLDEARMKADLERNDPPVVTSEHLAAARKFIDDRIANGPKVDPKSGVRWWPDIQFSS